MEEREDKQKRGEGADEDEENAAQDETGDEGKTRLESALDLVSCSAGAILDCPEPVKVGVVERNEGGGEEESGESDAIAASE